MDAPPPDLGVRVAAHHLSPENGPQTEAGDHPGTEAGPEPRGTDAPRKDAPQNDALAHPGRTVDPDRADPGVDPDPDPCGIRGAADRDAEDPGISADDLHPPSRIASRRRA